MGDHRYDFREPEEYIDCVRKGLSGFPVQEQIKRYREIPKNVFNMFDQGQLERLTEICNDEIKRLLNENYITENSHQQI